MTASTVNKNKAYNLKASAKICRQCCIFITT